MFCQFVQESVSGYLDERLEEPERGSVASHLASCRECAAVYGRTAQLRENLRSMPIAVAPKNLVTDLRVL